jgi:Ca2+-binding EF-hand superfamily protein
MGKAAAAAAAGPPADGATEATLREVFAELDADNSGALDRSEVAQLATKMGATLSEHDLDAAMAEMDADGSGDVDVEELLSWFKERKATSCPLMDLLQKKLPANETGLERELLKVMKGARDSALATTKFVPLDDVALGMPHRRRRAIIPTVPAGHARALQPAAYAFRSQAEVGKSWSTTIDVGVKARVLEIVAPFCKKEPTGCCCAVYDRIISRRYKPEPGVPGLELQFCLCKERTDQAQRSGGGGGKASGELIQRLFSEIDADQSGTLDREEIKLLALRLGKPMTERQLDEAMATMDADGGGEIDIDEFAAWFQSEGAASAAWAANLLQCAHCAEYGLGFSCGGWTERGYTAWERPEANNPAQPSDLSLPRSLRGYTREGGSRSGTRLEPEPNDRRGAKKKGKKKKKTVGSRYRSPNLRDLRHR